MAQQVLKPRRINSWPCEGGCGVILDDVLQRSQRRRFCDGCNLKLVIYRNTIAYRKTRVLEPRPCTYCGKVFMPKKKQTARFCSELCNIRRLKNIILHVNCKGCNVPIKSYGRRLFCTKKCKYRYYGRIKKELQNV